ncbi:hypothetical protein AC26_1452 [Escherichia coli 1-176-05_S3_C2]|nr:hypothetical protein AC26_1452 [Escherichia coli 1-176-05_S3_C2]
MLLFFLVETSYKGGKTHPVCKRNRVVIAQMMTGNGVDIE